VTLVLALWLAAAEARETPPNVADVDLPEQTDVEFRLGPGDRIGIKVYKHPDLDGEIVVAPDGSITMPLVGRLEVAEHTYAEVVAAIEASLRTFYTDVSVAVNVIEVTNRKVYVVGEVAQPMVLQVTGQLPMIEALTRSGGINPEARTNNLLLIRGGLEAPALYTVDVDRMLMGDASQNVALQPGDIVVVPTKTIVNVERFFRHVQGILAPFVSASQVYRNANVGSPQPVIEDTTP
jgi:polysaccharide biosynthesis/export protein